MKETNETTTTLPDAPLDTTAAETGTTSRDASPGTPRRGLPSWRRRVGFYIMAAAAAVIVVHLLDRAPVDVPVYWVLSGLELKTDAGRLDRSHLVKLTAEIRDGDEALVTTTMEWRKGSAPLKTPAPSVQLVPGEYDVGMRLVMETDDGKKREFALRRKVTVTAEGTPLLIDVR